MNAYLISSNTIIIYLCAKRTVFIKRITKMQEMCNNDLQIIYTCTHKMRNIDLRVHILELHL